jgi:hypothetical protein
MAQATAARPASAGPAGTQTVTPTAHDQATSGRPLPRVIIHRRAA